MKSMSGKTPFVIPSYKREEGSGYTFWDHIRRVTGINEAATENEQGGVFERNVPIVPDCIAQEEGEHVIRQYNICRLRTRLSFTRGEGRLMVTDQRLIFRAAGTSLRGNTLHEQQFRIGQIAGIDFRQNYRFSLMNLLGALFMIPGAAAVIFMLLSLMGIYWGVIASGILLGLTGLLPTFICYKRFWLKLVSAAGGMGALGAAMAAASGTFMTIPVIILMIITAAVLIADTVLICFIPGLAIVVRSKTGRAAVTITGRSVGYAEMMPWEDSISAINELGTMIDDLQIQGEAAVEKWTKSE